MSAAIVSCKHSACFLCQFLNFAYPALQYIPLQEAAAADIERVLGKKLLQERENEAESQNRYDEERREIAVSDIASKPNSTNSTLRPPPPSLLSLTRCLFLLTVSGCSQDVVKTDKNECDESATMSATTMSATRVSCVRRECDNECDESIALIPSKSPNFL